MSHSSSASPSSMPAAPVGTSVLVIGAGIAGLSFALRLPAETPMVIVTKGALGESNTWYAQGGLAAAVGADDDSDLHYLDTLAAGAGLSDPEAVRTLVDDGSFAVQWLIEQGTSFDRDNREFALGKEAAHSRHRVLHAGGDATGAEIERALVAQLRDRSSVTILEHTSAIELIVDGLGTCRGAYLVAAGAERAQPMFARTTVLANGGAGRLWAVTSDPPGASGDGIAMAMRSGVVVADLEFTQFHPTVLSIDGVEPFLITEAIRGEGAYLLDRDGNRFMVGQHELAELAPRDVVARAIQREVTAHDGKPVFLDLRHLDPAMVLHRFPTIASRLQTYGLDLTSDLIPVAPAAHYFMGGVVATTEGCTSMPGLIAIGEVSCTGVHGANRLASNSLLEGLVFGLRAADALVRTNPALEVPNLPAQASYPSLAAPHAPSDQELQIRHQIQRIMSTYVAVVRDVSGLKLALDQFDALETGQPRLPSDLESLLLLAREVTRSALNREESRGGHFRLDFPTTNPSLDGMHQMVRARGEGREREFGRLGMVLAE
ncbi:MAG TPA: L-aspartate oxidase [Thermomicrobiales bacterium]|nr:L-aspartate oxidase [Thermomicrobiales bacterium]